MKTRHTPILLSTLFLLSACGSTQASSLSSSLLPSSMEKSSQEVSSTRSEIISSSEEEVIPEDVSREKPNKAGYPYIGNLDKLKRHEFKGKWIWESKNYADTHVAFRRHFNVDSNNKKALLHLSAESKATVYLNGKLVAVDAVLKRGPSPFDSFYQDIDLSKAVRTGENTLVILVHFWGSKGNASVNSGQGGVLFDLELDNSVISSDTKTLVKRISAYRNERFLSPSGDYPDRERNTFLAEKEIYYDARLEEDYVSEGIDESGYSNAVIVGLPGCLPYGDLYLGDIPAYYFEDVKEASDKDNVLGKALNNQGTYHFGLPENMQFLPYFEIEGHAGDHITFYTNTYRTQGLVSLMDDYVLKEGKNTFLSPYWRSGYEILIDAPAGITIHKVGYARTGYGAKDEGSFVTNEERSNVLWQKASNTMHICMRDTFMDCPERERSPYSGDSANQIAECLYATGEDGWKMVKKTYDTLSGWAKDDKTFQLRWPSSTSNECPMQNLAFIQTLPDYLHHTGDIETTKEVFPILSEYLKVWNLNADGSVEYRPGSFMWTDWGSNQDEDLMENGWYYWALDSLLDLGKEIGIEDNNAFFQDRMGKIKGAFDAKFKRETGYSSDGVNFDDRANALAVLSGLVEEPDYQLALNVLDSTTNASPYMERFVLESLGKMGELEIMKERMLNRFSGMIDFEASTLWEEWSSNPEDGTINHGWAGGPLVVESKYLAGILPTSAGYDTYTISPTNLYESLEASVATPKGKLGYSLRKEGSHSILDINSLDGGTLLLDKIGKEALSISGNASQNADGSISLSKGNATIVLGAKS